MKTEYPESVDHTWVCRQTEGVLGEIQNFRILSSPQIEIIIADPAKMEEVCPGGEVVCESCEIPFATGQPAQAASAIDFKALEGQLVAPASGKQS
ncbi:MAG: hypothetical protein HYW63_04255 [Candidatus Levybacteria bacterium]|nr:hypothetical protein [Candidatus Levybacteria bacterium]